MGRRLRRLLSGIALAALCGAPGRGCGLCQAPPKFPPLELGPDDPFDARTPPGFLPGELDDLLLADDRRYRRQVCYFLDTKAPDPHKHLATTARIQGLLRDRAQHVISSLREKLKSGPISAEDRKHGLLLYWFRGPMLENAERDFLASLNRAKPSMPSLSALGETKQTALPAPVQPSPGEQLAERFLRQVELAGDAGQQAELQASIRLMLLTPTGEKLAKEFIASGVKARIAFIPFANSMLIEQNGKKMFNGTGGHCVWTKDRLEIGVNQDYLRTDRDYRLSRLPSTLGHELLGHGLGDFNANKAGVLDAYVNYYRGNEANAGLVGWSIAAELGSEMTDFLMWSYLKDPEDYYRQEQLIRPYYAQTLSPETIKDASSILEERLERSQSALMEIPRRIAAWENWRDIIAHFIVVHKMNSQSFDTRIADIDVMVKRSLPAQSAQLKTVIAGLEKNIAYLRGKDGAAELKRIEKQFRDDFFKRQAVQIEARRAHLESVIRDMSLDIPNRSNLAAWRELQEMYRKDREEFPEHWSQTENISLRRAAARDLL
ncbi:MAG TPA: hypothetical protein DEB40_11745 [Elusimicrobia bacterium]|nr:hypothetical protein [Elusimicrobiota bacterium]HBT62405.1 hypothetical protein [Elusimicrobiota bacterium]